MLGFDNIEGYLKKIPFSVRWSAAMPIELRMEGSSSMATAMNWPAITVPMHYMEGCADSTK